MYRLEEELEAEAAGEDVSEIETSPVSVITLVLRKIDLRQADYSIFLEVNHPCLNTV